jgi:hypothetical protein
MQTKKGKNRKEKDDAFAGRIINANEKKKTREKQKRKREKPQIHSRTSSSILKITMSNYIYNCHK